MDNGTGARGLRSVIEGFMLNVMYNISNYTGHNIMVTADYFKTRDLDDLIIEENGYKISIDTEPLDVSEESA